VDDVGIVLDEYLNHVHDIFFLKEEGWNLEPHWIEKQRIGGCKIDTRNPPAPSKSQLQKEIPLPRKSSSPFQSKNPKSVHHMVNISKNIRSSEKEVRSYSKRPLITSFTDGYHYFTIP
jgi:hypothetical protein